MYSFSLFSEDCGGKVSDKLEYYPNLVKVSNTSDSKWSEEM